MTDLAKNAAKLASENNLLSTQILQDLATYRVLLAKKVRHKFGKSLGTAEEHELETGDKFETSITDFAPKPWVLCGEPYEVITLVIIV